MNPTININSDKSSQETTKSLSTRAGFFEKKTVSSMRMLLILGGVLIFILAIAGIITANFLTKNQQDNRSQASSSSLARILLEPAAGNNTGLKVVKSSFRSFNLFLETERPVSGVDVRGARVSNLIIQDGLFDKIRTNPKTAASSFKTYSAAIFNPPLRDEKILLAELNIKLDETWREEYPPPYFEYDINVAAWGQPTSILDSQSVKFVFEPDFESTPSATPTPTAIPNSPPETPLADDLPPIADEGEPLASPTPTPTPLQRVAATPTPTPTPALALPSLANSQFRIHYSAASVINSRIYMMTQLYGRGSFRIQVLNSSQQVIGQSAIFNIDSTSTFKRYDFWFAKPASLAPDAKIYTRVVNSDATSTYTANWLTRLVFL